MAFEIRKSILGYIPDYPVRPEVEKACDDIDRMVILIGDIPFYDYFTKPFREIARLILDQVPPSLTPLFPAPAVIRDRLGTLVGSTETASFRDVISGKAITSSAEISLVLDSLEAYGVYLPRRTADPVKDEAKVEALGHLLDLNEAYTLTYRQTFETAKDAVPAIVSQTVIKARQTGALPQLTDGYCCYCSPYTGCLCEHTTLNDHCNLVNGKCSLTSNGCG